MSVELEGDDDSPGLCPAIVTSLSATSRAIPFVSPPLCPAQPVVWD